MATTTKLALYYPDSVTDGANNFNTDTMLRDNWVKLDGLFHETTGHKHTGAAGDGPLIGTAGLEALAVTTAKLADLNVTTGKLADKNVTAGKLADKTVGTGQLTDGAATDAIIGNRTITDTTIAAAGADSVTGLFSKLGNMVKAITGKAAWYTAPAISLEDVAGQLTAATANATAGALAKRDANGRLKVAAPAAADDVARKDTVDAHANRTDNPHAVTAAQVGAETPTGAQAKVDVHANRIDNPHGVTVAQIGAETPAGAQAKVNAAVAALINGAPGALDALNELAAAMGNDPNFATTMTNALAAKLNASAYTAADVLAKLLTVDGAGSVLDADTVDGVHGSDMELLHWMGV